MKIFKEEREKNKIEIAKSNTSIDKKRIMSFFLRQTYSYIGNKSYTKEYDEYTMNSLIITLLYKIQSFACYVLSPSEFTKEEYRNLNSQEIDFLYNEILDEVENFLNEFENYNPAISRKFFVNIIEREFEIQDQEVIRGIIRKMNYGK